MGSNGCTAKEASRLCIELGAKKAFLLDGGGSAQTIVYNQQVNKNHDGGGHNERTVRHFLYFEVENKGKAQRQNEISQILPVISETTRKALKNEVDIHKLKAGSTLTASRFLDPSEDICELEAGIYEATEVINGLSSKALTIYHVISGGPNAQLKMIYAYRMYDGQIFFRTINSKNNPAESGSGSWRAVKRSELLFSGNLKKGDEAVTLLHNLRNFKYIQVEYSFKSNADRVQVFRLKNDSSIFRISGADAASEGAYTYRADLAIQDSGNKVQIIDTICLLSLVGGSTSLQNILLGITKIYGLYDDFGGGKLIN